MVYQSPARAAKKQDTRRAIIEAATALFVAHGTEQPSLDAVCKAAGCTRGAFYVHFASREELIVAAMDEAIGTFIGGLLAPASSATAFVDGFLDAVIAGDPNVGGAALRFHHVLAACARYPAVRMRYLRILDLAAQAVAARLPPPNAAARAQLLVTISMGLLATVDLQRPVDLEQLRPLLRALAA